MTDKPDGAALVEWLQTWSPVTANGKRAHLAASELTRLAAENRTYAEAHAFNSARFAEMLSERDEAKAEIARLRELLKPFAESAAYYDIFGIYGGVPVRHLRDARAALKPATGEDDGQPTEQDEWLDYDRDC